MRRVTTKLRTLKLYLGPPTFFNVLGWVAVAFALALVGAMMFHVAGCEDDVPELRRPEYVNDWGDEYPGFTPGPSCPVPSSPHAATYVNSGGASNAWVWWMALHALTTDPGYHEPAVVHHHHYVRPVPAIRYTRPTRVMIAPPSQVQTNLGVKPVTAIKVMPVQSRSYGYKPATRKPASIKFKPSPTPSVRSAPPKPRTR